MLNFECGYEEECITRKYAPEKCSKCKNNHQRNRLEDFFTEADDEPIPEIHEEPEPYKGPAEQTEGYKCPVCHGFTNPYQLAKGKRCKWCGYPLFL